MLKGRVNQNLCNRSTSIALDKTITSVINNKKL